MYKMILIKISMNTNIMKMTINKVRSQRLLNVVCLLTFKSSDLITTLTYVFMDKFCTCFTHSPIE